MMSIFWIVSRSQTPSRWVPQNFVPSFDPCVAEVVWSTLYPKAFKSKKGDQ